LDLPGAATFGDRGIRHFLIKGDDSPDIPAGWNNAPVLATQVQTLLDNLTDYIGVDNVTEEAELISDNKSEQIDRIRAFHRFERALKDGMPLVSSELINWMVDYDNKTVTVQDVATQVAKITRWQQEKIIFAGDIPVFTGEFSEPSTGGDVKANALVAAVTRPLGNNAKSTAAELTDSNKNFWAPFAAAALKEQIMRNAIDLDLESILPKTEEDYISFLRGLPYTNYSSAIVSTEPSPAYMDARATIARGRQGAQRADQAQRQAGYLYHHLPPAVGVSSRESSRSADQPEWQTLSEHRELQELEFYLRCWSG